MLFPQRLWTGLADGSITVAFRRWKRPQAKTGGTHRTPAGVLRIDDVRCVDPADVTDREARAAGWSGADALVKELDRYGTEPVYRVAFHLEGPDPREALRRADTFTDDEWKRLAARLARLDRAAGGPWTARTLRLIAEHPEERAADLAARLGRERDPFKIDVRKLKELGLTESLEVGYRISPRGRVCLARLETD
jgi:hypothetical protein